MSSIFMNDNNVEIFLLDHPYSEIFKRRNIHEGIFRQINTYLINNNIIDKNKNIIDLGAWIGDNSIPWAKNINGIVYAIDPSKENCKYIYEMSILNNINNIIVIKGAISDSEKIISTDSTDLHHCSFNDNNSLNNKIQAFCLDTLLYKKKIIDNIGYIHLDVESMEYLVLKGSSQLINKLKPIITFEQHLNTDNYMETSTFLLNKDYSVFLINEQLLGCREDCRNFIAFPNTSFNIKLIDSIEESLNYKGLFVNII